LTVSNEIEEDRTMVDKSPEQSLFHNFLKAQLQKMKTARKEAGLEAKPYVPVVTVSIDPGSGGSVVARKVADRFGFDFFNREIIKEIAASVRIEPDVIEHIEKERHSGMEDLIDSCVRDTYLWPGMYLEHLEKVLCALGEHGRAVIVGRGGNFILPREQRFSVRVTAPGETRVENIAKAFGVTAAKAKKRIKGREEKRAAFIRKSFQKDVRNPLHYDMVLNTEFLSIEDCTDLICLYLERKFIQS
jgi:cytidylate kinase